MSKSVITRRKIIKRCPKMGPAEATQQPNPANSSWYRESMLRCPHCDHAFNPDVCEVKTPEDAYWESERHCSDNERDEVYEAQQDHHDLLRELGFPGGTGAKGLEGADDLIKCGHCHQRASRLRWLIPHTLNTRSLPAQVTLAPTDDVGHQPSAKNQYLSERAAALDAIMEELSQATAKRQDDHELAFTQARKTTAKRHQSKASPRKLDPETERQIERAVAEVLREQKRKRGDQ